MGFLTARRVPGVAALQHWVDDNQLQIMRAAVIVLVLGGALVLGRRPAVAPLAVLGLAGLGVAMAFWRWPVAGILLTVLGGMVVPYYGPSGLNVTMMGIALLTALWLGKQIVINRRIEVACWPPIRGGLVFLAAAVISFLVGNLPWYPTQHAPLGAQLGGLSLILLSVCTMVVVSNQVKTVRALEFLTYGLLAYCSLHPISFLVPGTGRLGLDRLFPATGTGSMFWVWITVMALSMALFNRKLALPWRLALGLQAAAFLYVVYFRLNDWKSGWVPTVIGLGVTLMAAYWQVIVLALLGAAAYGSVLVQRLVTSDEYSFSTRLDAWVIMAQIVKVNPVVGLGPANYYWYTPLFPIRGYSVRFNSHSQYADIIVQYGFVGLAAYVYFIFELLRVTWQMYRPRLEDDFARAYVYGAVGGLVASVAAGLFGDWVFPFFYNVGLAGFRASVLPWIFMGGLMALSAMKLGREKR